MEIAYASQAREDLKYWRKSGNKIIQKKIQQLIDSIKETPFEGIGKPEALKYHLSGLWSRRIDHEHRITYEVIGDRITIISMRYHYSR